MPPRRVQGSTGGRITYSEEGRAWRIGYSSNRSHALTAICCSKFHP